MVLKSIALVILSVLLVVSLTVSIIGLDVSQLIYPNVYENAFDKSGVYYMLSQKLPNNSAVTQVFFQEEIKANINRLVEGSLSYVRSETDDITLSLQIDDFRIRAYLEGVYPHLPICAPGQYSLKDGQECRPENMSPSMFVDYVLTEKNITGSNMQMNIPGIKDQLSNVRGIVRTFMTIVWIFVILSVIFAFVIILIKKISGIKIIGICMIVSGAISAVVGILISGAVGNFIAQIKPELLSNILRDIIVSVFNYLIVIGIIVAGIGLILIYLTKPKKNQRRRKSK
jgi:hypothetical protein